MAAKIGIIVQRMAPKTQINETRKNETTIQATTPKIIPSIPSPISANSVGTSKLADPSGTWSNLISLVILPRSSFNLIPLYKLTDKKRKKAKDKMLTERREFSKSVLC